ncbi:pitrilysin family protein [Limnobacter sp.]|uniref:M16 family metallopeptidase n=1 Tax=Limnobacter sp. TaxID=2003368 RepID=UPI002585A216|nr:pitrilysin family protein [Limnobacter sp.]
MLKQRNTVVTALFGLALMAFAGAANATLPIQTWKTDSGAKVMFMRTEALPMLDVRVDFPAGSRNDPAGKEGLASVVTDMLGRGAKGMSEDQIADGFADTGANFGSDAGVDYAGFQLRTLTAQPQFDKSIALFEKVMQQPEFKDDILKRELSRSVSDLKEELTKPGPLASRAFMQAMYPKHPYGTPVTEASLNAITLKDVQDFYQNRYLVKYAVVSMVGNLTREQAEKLANQLTANLPQGTLTSNPLGGEDYEALQAQEQGKLIHIDHPAEQSHILMGLPAMRRGTPDYFDLLVANHVIGGGGFVSRLMNEIREKRGLAYSVYSYFMPLGDAGPYQVGMQTRRDKTHEALGLLNSTLDNFIQNGPTQAELDAAKKNLIGGFPLRIDSNSDLVANLSMMGIYNMPLNFLDTWTSNIQKVTVQSAREAFARHVKKDKLVTVVVGGQP